MITHPGTHGPQIAAGGRRAKSDRPIGFTVGRSPAASPPRESGARRGESRMRRMWGDASRMDVSWMTSQMKQYNMEEEWG
eukprot:3833613-Pyramimonas_sp.AAC.1